MEKMKVYGFESGEEVTIFIDEETMTLEDMEQEDAYESEERRV